MTTNTANRTTLQQINRDLRHIQDLAVETDGIGIADIRIDRASLEIAEAICVIKLQM